ncbi:MAG: flippase-like domain-containing protein [Chloroflexota bacterium]|nr:flippase-like domain-containing protein [Chloroflexota bacterium]
MDRTGVTKQAVRWGVGLLLSGLFLWAVLRGADLGRVGATIAGAQRSFLLPVLAVSVASIIMRAWRWMLCFDRREPLPLPDSLAAYSLGSLSSYVIPARLGDLVRVYAVGQTAPISRMKALGTLVIERLSDLFAVVILVSLLLPLFDLPRWIVSVDILAAVACVVALVVVYLLAHSSRHLRLPGWASRYGLVRRMSGLVARLLDGFAAIKSTWRALSILGASFAVWLLTIAFYVAAFHSLALPLGWREGALLTGVLALVAIVPAGPGYVGSFELAAVALLGLFQIDRSVTIGYVEFTRIVSFIALALLTLVGAGTVRMRAWLRPRSGAGAIDPERLPEGSAPRPFESPQPGEANL